MDGCILLVPTTAAAVPIKQSACGPRRPPSLVLFTKTSALSQDITSKQGHLYSVTYGAWQCYSSVYTTIPRTGICGVDNDIGQSVIELGSTSSCRAYTAVYVCYSVDQFFSTLVHSTFRVQVKFVLFVPMLQWMAKWKQYDIKYSVSVQWSVWVRKFHKYVRDCYNIGIFYNIIISLITVDKGKKVKA